MEFKDYFRDTPNGWIMQQILLDNMALGEGIPLRIIKLDELLLLYEHFLNTANENKKSKFKKYFPNQKSFDFFSQEVSVWFLKESSEERVNETIFGKFKILAGLYEDFSYKIFPVLPASLHSLEFLAQTMVKYWRIYALLWLYQHLALRGNATSNDSACLENTYGLKHFWLRYQHVKMKSNGHGAGNVILLAGPVFEVSSEVLTNETGVDEEVTDNAEKLLKQFTQRCPEESRNGNSYFQQAIHLETVRLNKFLAERFDKVIEIWNLLLASDIKGNTKISHKWLRMFTVWAQYISQVEQEKKRFTISLVSDGLTSEKTPGMTFFAEKMEDRYSLIMQTQSLGNDVHLDQVDMFYDLYTRLERKTKQLEKNRLIVMDLWLESHFSALLSKTNNEEDLGYRLAAWICAAMRADIAELHSYFPENTSQPLKIHEIYLREKKFRPYRPEIVTALEELSESNQEISNIYQVLSKGKERVCLCQDPTCPKGSSLLSLNEIISSWPEEKKEEAEMVVPIKFNGRVLGAIEVASFRAWRFRWGQRMLLLNIATSLGSYWYQQRHLECLSKIQKKVLEFDQEECEKGELYNAICEQAAVLFLCRGAGLWIRDENNSDLFVRQGRHAIKVGQNELSVSNRDSLISWLVREREKVNDFYPEAIGVSSELNEVNRKHLQDYGINYLAYIPIRAQPDNESSEIIAVLALYDHSEQGFDKSWCYIARFFSGHLHVVIDSVANAIKERESIKKMMLHQVHDSASHLADKASKIASPVVHQVSELNKIHAVLSGPKVKRRLDMAEFMDEIPSNINVTDSLKSVIAQLNSRSMQPLKDVKKYAGKLRNQIGTFSADFKRDQEIRIEEIYGVNKEKIPKLLQKARSISCKTDDDFLRFIHSEKLLNAEPETFNLRALVTEVSTAGGYTPLDFSGVDYSVALNINRDALTTVLTNLWVNARKYRLDKSEAIIWNTEFKRNGACILQISNPSLAYSKSELDKLEDKGYRHPFWQKPGRKQHVTEGYDAGLGLYIVSNLCLHILNITFDINQVPRNENRSEFVCELQFDINSIVKW